tara:strand:+ start:941 stop:1168 length:228 start_codon:yes stop_codon:yes gene_type:complete
MRSVEGKVDIMFDGFPENIQRAMYSHGCDPRSFILGKVEDTYEDYEYTRDDLLKLCEHDKKLRGRVVDYLIEVYP